MQTIPTAIFTFYRVMRSINTIAFLLLFTLNGLAQTDGDTLFNAFFLQSNPAGVTISFTVKGGIQCSGVAIERSGDGINYDEIYEFPGVCGNPGADETYSYVDADPLINQLNYYRLNIGGLGLYSSEKSIRHLVFSEGNILVTPNPCTNCTLLFPNDKRERCLIRTYKTNGEITSESLTNESTYVISTVAGMQIISIEYPDKNTRKAVFLKQD